MLKADQLNKGSCELTNTKLSLVTTELQETWPDDGEVLFLGEWCKLHRERESWSCLKSSTQPFRWDNRATLQKDYDYLQLFNQELLEDLGPILNNLHGVDKDTKYWQLLLGYWISICSAVIFDRWHSIKLAGDTYSNLEAKCFDPNIEYLATNSMLDFLLAAQDPYWNSMVYSLCIDTQNVIVLKNCQCSIDKTVTKSNSSSIKEAVIQSLKTGATRLLWYLKRKEKIVLFNSKLSHYSRMTLESRFGQFPISLDYLGSNSEYHYSEEFRNWSLSKISSSDDFKDFFRQIIPKLMPRVFLEGFKDSALRAKAHYLPQDPAVIFTSSSHFFDHKFNFWCAEHRSKGAQFVVGEHGGLGVGKFNAAHSFELNTADIYLSTGWINAQLPKILAVGNFREDDPDRFRKRPLSNRAIMVCGSVPRYVFDVRSMALGSQTKSYFEDLFNFMGALECDIQSRIDVRLDQDYQWGQEIRWRERFPKVNLQENKKPLSKAMIKSKLFIGTYCATTYLEALSRNVPSVIFWDPMLWEIKSSAKPFFSDLEKVGVFHRTPISAASHINIIWDDIDSWWYSADVQKARLRLLNAFYSSSEINGKKTIDHIYDVLIELGS